MRRFAAGPRINGRPVLAQRPAPGSHAEELAAIYEALAALRDGAPRVRLAPNGSPDYDRIAALFDDLAEHDFAAATDAGGATTRTEQLLEQSQLLAAELQETNRALEEKAKQLALTSKYKSEFLANMSHELRTPLNSVLLLSDTLAKNAEGNLTSRQVESANTIHASGHDLLALINDILDLSKIESGTVVAEVGELRPTDLQRYVERAFRHVAEFKQLAFDVRLDPALPKTLHTDIKRLQQIIKNLLANAFKFTHEGSVTLSVERAANGWSPQVTTLEQAREVVAFAVEDTGIGICKDKHEIIFHAFRQADGSTSREYGGTGLGLAISRELAKLLGGEIRLTSVRGEGSTFTLYLPVAERERPSRGQRSNVVELRATADGAAAGSVPADRARPSELALVADPAGAGELDRAMLIVEHDAKFAATLAAAARRRGLTPLISPGAAAALPLIREYAPAMMWLDTALPDICGWRLLGRLKADLALRSVPVCVAASDDSRARAFEAGACAFVARPTAAAETLDRALRDLDDYVSRPRKRLAVLMPPSADLDAVLERASAAGIDAIASQNAADIRLALRDPGVDCLVVEAGAADLDPAQVIESMPAHRRLRPIAVVVYGATGPDSLSRWRRRGGVRALREARSLGELVDAICFFSHRRLVDLPAAERRAIEEVDRRSTVLDGKTALIVDDDMRSIFALSTTLHDHGMRTVCANDGRDAIRLVEEDRNIDIVLTDVMMSEMDGMATMRELRQFARPRELPIVAVTAKAMKGDREKCIEAGAWDYLAKPVDPIRLLSVMRSWLAR